jgi:hypothetical protein
MGVRLDRSIDIARGNNAEATKFAGEVCSYWEEMTGVPLIWGLEVGGTVGRIHWYADYEDFAALEASFGLSMSDEGYGKLLATADDLFVGMAHDTWVYTM